MLNPNDFNADLHMTIVLFAAAFTLMGIHAIRFVFAGRDRANALEDVIAGIQKDEMTHVKEFKKNMVEMTRMVHSIEDEVSSGYDSTVLEDLASHDERTIRDSQDSLRRREKVAGCIDASREVDARLVESTPRNATALNEVDVALMKIKPALQDFEGSIIALRSEQDRLHALNDAIGRLEETAANTERALIPIHQRYKR